MRSSNSEAASPNSPLRSAWANSWAVMGASAASNPEKRSATASVASRSRCASLAIRSATSFKVAAASSRTALSSAGVVVSLDNCSASSLSRSSSCCSSGSSGCSVSTPATARSISWVISSCCSSVSGVCMAIGVVVSLDCELQSTAGIKAMPITNSNAAPAAPNQTRVIRMGVAARTSTRCATRCASCSTSGPNTPAREAS